MFQRGEPDLPDEKRLCPARQRVEDESSRGICGCTLEGRPNENVGVGDGVAHGVVYDTAQNAGRIALGVNGSRECQEK